MERSSQCPVCLNDCQGEEEVIVLNALFPVFALLLCGIILKRMGLIDPEFLKKSDRLIYYFFFPVMLFWKIGGASFGGPEDWRFCGACLAALGLMFLISTLLIPLTRIGAYQAGTFSQSCYRFNTYIGVAVILNGVGSEGLASFGVMIGFAIPIINVVAVSVLIWYGGEKMDLLHRLRITGRAILSNPLILGCIAGIGYSRLIGGFPDFIDKSLSLASMVALPLALLSVGGSLNFSGVRHHLKNATLAVFCKLVLLPLLGYATLTLFGVEGNLFRVGMIFFALPASTAIYVLSSQMNSDTELAGATIVLSTLFSFVSLSVALLL